MGGDRPNYAVVGHPIAHSLSPLIHAAFARQTGETDVRYGRLDLAPDDFVAGCRAFFARGGLGLNVTAPHKSAALELCDSVSAGARLAAERVTMSHAGRVIVSTRQEQRGQYGHRWYQAAIDAADDARFAVIAGPADMPQSRSRHSQ